MFVFIMRFTFGMKFYGKSDIVPGLFYVGTKCFHIWGVPILPYGSALVYENSRYIENSASNANSLGDSLYKTIPFNLKSLLFFVARLVLLTAFIADLVYLLAAGEPYFTASAATAAGTPSPGGATLLTLSGAALACCVSIALLYRSFRMALATEERALALAAIAGLPNELVLRNLAYKGYPLRRPGKQLRFHQCRRCGAVNILRREPPGDGSSACTQCKSPIALISRRRLSLPVIIQAGFVLALVAIAAYFVVRLR